MIKKRDYIPISQRIQEGLEMRNMKANRLSELSGVAKSSISDYINGKGTPNSKTVFKLANALNVSEAWLLGASDSYERQSDSIYMTTQEESLVSKFRKLDEYDKIKVESYTDGLLSNDKYHQMKREIL